MQVLPRLVGIAIFGAVVTVTPIASASPAAYPYEDEACISGDDITVVCFEYDGVIIVGPDQNYVLGTYVVQEQSTFQIFVYDELVGEGSSRHSLVRRVSDLDGAADFYNFATRTKTQVGDYTCTSTLHFVEVEGKPVLESSDAECR